MIQLTERQERIVEAVKKYQPITSDEIARKLNVSRSALRVDLSVLTLCGILGARPKVGYYYDGNSIQTWIKERMEELRVGQFKSVPVVVEGSRTVYDVVVTMFLEDVGTVFVTQEGCLAGVVSRKDVLRSALGGNDMSSLPVGVIMTRMPNIICVQDEDTILSAAQKMIFHEVDSLPVVEVKENGSYVVTGRVTKTTVTRIFQDFAKE